MGAYRFSMAPNISVPRSRFKMPFNHTTTFNHGKLVPIDCFEILPGDEFKCNLSALIRMSTPIAPIMGNITAHVHAFFVPMRLVWEHTQEFYGENKTSAGYQQTVYSIPSRAIDLSADAPDVGSVSHYLGKPIAHGSGTAAGATSVSILKERGYYLIWNEYYRAQQLQNPVLITLDDTSGIGYLSDGNLTDANQTIDFTTSCMNVCKEFDYFTACTVAPQYGAAVQLPLGSTAPVVVSNIATNISAGGPIVLASHNAVNSGSTIGQIDTYKNSVGAGNGLGVLEVDLANATAASINSIRYAWQVQKWLERANFGSRFFEMLNLHYGVTSPDARLQRPEYLGGFDFRINVDQVIAMSGAYNASDSEYINDLGQTGAVSVTGIRGKNLFNKAFVEPGYVYVLISTTHERSYAGNILREDLRSDRFDFYFPEFANLGDQIVYKDEIHYLDFNGLPKNGGEFGYQEHWAEYRYRANRVSGFMDPYANNTLDYWNLADDYGSTIPTLSNSWIMEDRNQLARCLASMSDSYITDYIADFYFDYTAIREMPLYTIPGLVDHFGTM